MNPLRKLYCIYKRFDKAHFFVVCLTLLPFIVWAICEYLSTGDIGGLAVILLISFFYVGLFFLANS